MSPLLWGLVSCGGVGCAGFLVGMSIEYTSFSYLKGLTLLDFKHSRDNIDCKIVSCPHSILTSFLKNGNPLTLQHRFSGG